MKVCDQPTISVFRLCLVFVGKKKAPLRTLKDSPEPKELWSF